MTDIKKYARRCPLCNKELYYSHNKYRNSAEKLKSLCRQCSFITSQRNNPKQKFTCHTCNNEFMEWRSQVSNVEKPFCSKKCWYESGTKSLVNQRFGRLVAQSRSRRFRTTYYICKCDCGNEVEVEHSNLINSALSCGCLITETRGLERKSLEDVVARSIWNYYKRNAKTRNYEWNISYETFIKRLFEKCFYCNTEPKSIYTWKYKYETKTLLYNGIDRIDNKVGYNDKNIVTCCYTCNRAKGDLTLEEFMEWANKLVSNLQKKEVNACQVNKVWFTSDTH